MTNKRSTKRALLLSALSLLLCVSMLVGSTFAWFTDSVTSGQNKIQSGNLDVQLFYTYDAAVAANADSNEWVEVTSTTDVFGYNLWEPGYTKIAYFKIVNNGSLELKYQLAADVYAEKAGKNQGGATFLLSDYIKTALVPTTATRNDILALEGTALKASFGMSKGSLNAKDGAKDSAVVGMAIWMPTTVGNEANHDGTNVPEITFGINLIATQATYEKDSFGDDYDEDAVYPEINLPAIMTAGVKVDSTTTRYDIPLRTSDLNGDEYAKQGSVVVFEDSVADDAENIEVVIKKLPVADSSVPVGQNETATTIDVSVTGIKEGNTTPIEVTVNIGAGLGTVKLYHKNVEIPSTDYNYNNSNGILIFKSASFSPFTMVYGFNSEAPTDTNKPNAKVEDANQYEGVAIEWSNSVGMLPGDLNQTLDAVYTFTAPHDSETVEKSAYKDWHCDYYVMLRSNTLETLPEGYITLAGNYGTWGWVGFDNPEVNTNEYIPLLGSVTQNPWTYEMVVDFVAEFICGVGKTAKAGDALNGAEFVVQLRLTNPDDANDFHDASTIIHKF